METNIVLWMIVASIYFIVVTLYVRKFKYTNDQNNQGFTLFKAGLFLAFVAIVMAVFNEFTPASFLSCFYALILIISGIIRMCEWTKTTSWMAIIVIFFFIFFFFIVYISILVLVILATEIFIRIRKPLKKLIEMVKNLSDDAWAFISDPEARAVSKFNYPSGSSMSVREARKKGLIN